jgi:hypothetical protein
VAYDFIENSGPVIAVLVDIGMLVTYAVVTWLRGIELLSTSPSLLEALFLSGILLYFLRNASTIESVHTETVELLSDWCVDIGNKSTKEKTSDSPTTHERLSDAWEAVRDAKARLEAVHPAPIAWPSIRLSKELFYSVLSVLVVGAFKIVWNVFVDI